MNDKQVVETGDEYLERVRIAAGEPIFCQGDDGSDAYIIESGQVALHQHLDGHRVELGTLGKGEIFGEMAVLDRSRRSANAVAVDDSVLLRVSAATFQQRLATSDTFIRALIELFIKNIRTSPRLFLRRPRSFRDHVKQMSVFSWNLRRFAGRLDDVAMADDVLDILDRLDTVLDDLANVAELTADKRHDLIVDEEMHGVEFADVIGTDGRRQL